MSLSTDDRLAIEQLYARYNHAIDAGKGEDWANCFTADGTFTSAGNTFTGKDQLAGFATGFAQRLKARHWTNNLIVEPAGSGATGTCYLALFRLTPGEQPPASVLTTAIYNDTLVKAGGEWKFSSRSVTGDS